MFALQHPNVSAGTCPYLLRILPKYVSEFIHEHVLCILHKSSSEIIQKGFLCILPKSVSESIYRCILRILPQSVSEFTNNDIFASCPDPLVYPFMGIFFVSCPQSASEFIHEGLLCSLNSMYILVSWESVVHVKHQDNQPIHSDIKERSTVLRLHGE